MDNFFGINLRYMLDKRELKQVQEVVATTISEVFKKDLFPFLEEKFDAIDKRFDENSEDHAKIFRKLDRNTIEHDKMFERLDISQQKIDNHEKRIKKLETITKD